MNRLREALSSISSWLRANGGSEIVEDLAPPASVVTLKRAETALGFTIPRELVDLWSLHDGVRSVWHTGFVDGLDLLGVEAALEDRTGALFFVRLLRDAPAQWAEAGITDAEVRSDAWLPFAAFWSQRLMVSAVSGRVFGSGKEGVPVWVEAASVTEWFERHAARVVADGYRVEDDEEGRKCLARRNVEAEVRAAAEAAKAAELEAFRRSTPVLVQLEAALGTADDRRVRELMEEAHQASPALLAQAVELLLSRTSDEKRIASALQWVLRVVELTAAQWDVVARGAEALGNDAIRSVALERRGA